MEDPRIAETDALSAELEMAGLLVREVQPGGTVTYTLTPNGARLGHVLAMGASDEERDELLEAMLDPGGVDDD